MSNWAYVSGIISVSVYGRTQHEIEYVLKTVLDHLPIVHGSERDMDVYTIKKNGHNCGSSVDEFEESTNNLSSWRGDYKSRREGWLETQNEYILVVDGSLRDTDSNIVYKEFIRWLTRLSKRIRVRDVNVRIHDSWYDDEHIIRESKKWENLYECVRNNWTSYLYWDYPRDAEGEIVSYNPHR